MVNICWDLESVFNDSDCTSWKGRIITHSKFSDAEFKIIQSAIENRSELKMTDDDVEFVVDSLVSEGVVKKTLVSIQYELLLFVMSELEVVSKFVIYIGSFVTVVSVIVTISAFYLKSKQENKKWLRKEKVFILV